jgi:hypothetical protein
MHLCPTHRIDDVMTAMYDAAGMSDYRAPQIARALRPKLQTNRTACDVPIS